MAAALPISATLPVSRACELARQPPEQRWLIQGLWAAQGVGLIGGHPKCGKSWLGLEIAVSLASATPCLGRFAPARQGRVLLYMAEDAIPDVRARLESLCHHHGVDLASLDIFVITADTLRIDQPQDQQRLRATVSACAPDLLLLDPLVRLHGRDENSSQEMAVLLGFLRQIQRQLGAAVVLVHHTRKTGAGQPGQALRGSSDLHAFGDSNLYLSRQRERLLLAVEHRAAPSPEPLHLALVERPTPHLEIVEDGATRAGGLHDAVLELLRERGAAMTRAAIRHRLAVKNERLGKALEGLEASGRVERAREGWRAASLPHVPVPLPGSASGNTAPEAPSGHA